MLLRMRLRSTAKRFADRGWPVTPGSYFNGTRMACDRPTCWATSCHPVLPDWEKTDWEKTTESGDWWADRPHSVLLPTGRIFDVIEVPTLLGAKVRGPFGPVAITPSRQWMFLVQKGAPLRPELDHRTDIVLHSTGSWVPAPPTLLPEGSVRWHISPQQVHWNLPDSSEVQRAMVSALVALDASFLDLPLSARRRTFAHAHAMEFRPSTVETALRRAA